MAVSHVLVFCLCLASLTTEVTSQRRRCSRPTWPSSLDLEDPVASHRGKVVVVALMKGYCSYCVRQAQSLEEMKNQMAEQGFPDIEIILVNGGENISRINVHNLQNAGSLPVLQDTADHVLYNRVFNGRKDDFIVFDRCGQRAFIIPHPYSYMGYNITERVVNATYRGLHPCQCRRDSQVNVRDRMQGDQPRMVQPNQVATRTTGQGIEIECPGNDKWCERYLTKLARGTLGQRRFNRRRQGMARGRRHGNMRRGHGRHGGRRRGPHGGRRRGPHGGRKHGPHDGRRHGPHGGRVGHHHRGHHQGDPVEGSPHGTGLLTMRSNQIGGAGNRPFHRRRLVQRHNQVSRHNQIPRRHQRMTSFGGAV